MSHSRRSARSASVTPARISGRSVASARSATAQAAAIRSTSSGCLSARRASTQPSTGTSSTSGAAVSRRSHSAWRDGGGLDGDPSRADRGEQPGPGPGQVVADLVDVGLGGLPPGLDRVSRVRHDDDLVGADDELAGMPRDAVLALREHEACQPAHVLAPGAEVGVDTLSGHPVAQRGDALGSVAALGLGPPPTGRRVRRRGKVGRDRQAAGHVSPCRTWPRSGRARRASSRRRSCPSRRPWR